MKIGIFLNDSNIPISGGAFTQREAIIEAIMKKKSSHEIFYFFYGRKPTDKVSKNCVYLKGKIFSWLCKKIYYVTGFQFFKNIMPLNISLKKNKIDLLYFVEPNPQPVVVPYISTVWDIFHLFAPYFPEIINNEEWEKRELMYQRSLRKSSYVITSTQVGKNDISKYYSVPKEKIMVIKSPIIDFFYNSPKKEIDVRKKYSISKDYFLYPAQLWAHKNHVQIIQAISYIKKSKNKEVHIVLVGSDKGNKEYLEKMAEKESVSNQIHFLGFVPTEDLFYLYKNAFGAIYLSFLNVEGLPPAEAQVIGCPVIVTNNPALREQLGNAALFVNPLDCKELASLMLNLINNKKLRFDLIRKGKIISKEFQKEKFVEKLFEIFDEFAELRKRWD